MEVNELSHSVLCSAPGQGLMESRTSFYLSVFRIFSRSFPAPYSILKVALLRSSLSPPTHLSPPHPIKHSNFPFFPLWPYPSALSFNLSCLMRVCKEDLDRQQLWIRVKARLSKRYHGAWLPFLLAKDKGGNWFLQTEYQTQLVNAQQPARCRWLHTIRLWKLNRERPATVWTELAFLNSDVPTLLCNVSLNMWLLYSCGERVRVWLRWLISRLRHKHEVTKG